MGIIEVGISLKFAPKTNPEQTVGQIVDYYNRMEPSFLNVWQGACHFGYTEKGERFELKSALKTMEMRLGQELNLHLNSTVLDAGCGYARVATTMAQQFGLNVLA